MVIAGKKREKTEVVCVNGNWTISEIKQPKQANICVSDKTVSSEIIGHDKIEKAVQALLDLHKARTGERQSLFENEAEPIFLQISCVKIPRTPDRILRLLLPHSLRTDTADVCLFVPDLVKGLKEDHEPTIEHYKDLLQKHGVTGITQIIPLRQLRTEHYQYELRRRLCQSFDFFLAEARICGRLAPLLGKAFHISRKGPTPIKLGSNHLKGEIEKALRKTPLYITSKGDCSIVQVAHTNQHVKEIIENFIATIEALKTVYPGGLCNIKSLQIKTRRSMSIPVYLNLRTPNSVKVPIVNPRKPKASVAVEGELSTLPGAIVTVLPNGDVIVKRVKDENITDESESENSEDEDEGTLHHPTPQKYSKEKKQMKKVVKEEPENEDSGVEAAEDAYLSEWHNKTMESSKAESGEKNIKHEIKNETAVKANKRIKDESFDSKVNHSKAKRKKIHMNIKSKVVVNVS